ncbi:MAG: hypothetical protein PHU81_02335 [Acidobacteriota bacterium]|nr:hypothetical protein [Acidobacteriota bacterium]
MIRDISSQDRKIVPEIPCHLKIREENVTIGPDPEERLEGTIASVIISYLRGAVIFRLHDIQAVKKALQVAESIVKEIKVAG